MDPSLNHEVVKTRRAFLFRNWLAYNIAHDLRLPGAQGAPVPFLMYPQAETADGRADRLDPDNFKYAIKSWAVGAG